MNTLATALDTSKRNGEAPLVSLWSGMLPETLVNDLRDHPFLVACRSGVACRASLNHFLVQHEYYTSHFTRYLCAVMASLPSSRDVRSLCENLFEEMGLDSAAKETHAQMYTSTMAELGVLPGSMPPLPETTALIDSMYRYCRSTDPLDGLSALCLGAEAIVPALYAPIIEGFKAFGVPDHALRYFDIHVRDDEAHALTMRRVIDEILRLSPWRLLKVQAIADDIVRRRMALLTAVHTH